jgi:hypothetical protein
MDASEIRSRIQDIAEIIEDNEGAHAREDALYKDVLGAIAAGAPDPASLAEAALEARALDYDRWYS